MKLFKLTFIFSVLASVAMALNFNGVQSMVGVNGPPTSIFVAPASSTYFVQGYLNLPQFSSTAGQVSTRVVATVSKNYVTLLYTGAPGASGFHLPNITLVSNDRISANLTSALTSDSVTQNGIKINGQVYYGNNF